MKNENFLEAAVAIALINTFLITIAVIKLTVKK